VHAGRTAISSQDRPQGPRRAPHPSRVTMGCCVPPPERSDRSW
jgi:hypothetical protein